ncbi:hypothetical protein EDC01DRAFT_779122 [Geopyxis carbonaria]|nr:hypothetical protein EDC01DRAFT_779122 [Geopyxis carbonaria]
MENGDHDEEAECRAQIQSSRDACRCQKDDKNSKRRKYCESHPDECMLHRGANVAKAAARAESAAPAKAFPPRQSSRISGATGRKVQPPPRLLQLKQQAGTKSQAEDSKPHVCRPPYCCFSASILGIENPDAYCPAGQCFEQPESETTELSADELVLQPAVPFVLWEQTPWDPYIQMRKNTEFAWAGNSDDTLEEEPEPGREEGGDWGGRHLTPSPSSMSTVDRAAEQLLLEVAPLAARLAHSPVVLDSDNETPSDSEEERSDSSDSSDDDSPPPPPEQLLLEVAPLAARLAHSPVVLDSDNKTASDSEEERSDSSDSDTDSDTEDWAAVT